MKKLLMAFAFVACGMIFANAQTAPATKSAPAKKETAKPAPAKQEAKPAAEKKQDAVKPATAQPSEGTVMKKDGTPDKRYKAKPAGGKMKKDGTPDKRYKENKDAKPAK